MKKTTKILTAALALVLVVVVAIGATVAYLTSKPDAVVNTFTIGKIQITLDEKAVDEYGDEIANTARRTANTYKLIPGETYTKDPTVHVQPGSEKCYVFVKVEDGLATLRIEAATTIADQIAAKGWTALGNAYPGVYYQTVDAIADNGDVKDLVVFEEFTITDDADLSGVVASGETNATSITVTAYAIQFAGFESNVTGAWTTVSAAASNP